MKKHTPGPWRVVEDRTSEGPCVVLAVDADERPHEFSIIEGAVFVDADPEVNAANQRLVAAAPDLLDAVEKTLALTGLTRMCTHSGDCEWDRAREAALAARAKAAEV